MQMVIEQKANVAHITENYILHYLYMSPELYNTIFDTKIESNVVLAKTNDLNRRTRKRIRKNIAIR